MSKEYIHQAPANFSIDMNTSHGNKLYSLKEGIYLVSGAKRAAICDTTTSNVYSINEIAKEVFMGQSNDPEFSKEMNTLKLTNNNPPELVQKENNHIPLEFVWFEITNTCNEKCMHCYADSNLKSEAKNGNFKDSSKTEDSHTKLSADQWKKLIKESYDLGSKDCQFIGGEPFLWRGENKETVLHLAEYAKNLGYDSIELFTNGTLLKDKDIERIKQLGLNMAVSLYSNKENVHDKITRTPGSFKKTLKTLELLRNIGIKTRVETVLMSLNQDEAESVNEFSKSMGFNHRFPDIVRPGGRGANLELQPDEETFVKYGLILNPNFETTPGSFKKNVNKHPCLSGKITITENGDILPCIFSRNKIIGNVLKEGSLKKLVEGPIQDVWKITKDNVLVCQDCEYRYVCFDCRPLSEAVVGDKGDYKTAPYPRCTYDPYNDKWENGIWKLDEDGTPFYDESLKPIIEKFRFQNK